VSLPSDGVSLPLPAGPRDDLLDVAGLGVGHARVPGGGSGCTVVTGPFRARVQVHGSAGGSREFVTLAPGHVSRRADAVLLTGGSAYGLAAADGVMAVLAERERGFPTSAGVVPIVPAAVLFDLALGKGRPGPEEGRAACEEALSGTPPPMRGPVGAGAGATVGKLLGPEFRSPSGLGSASVLVGEATVAALVVVNAVGDVTGPDGTVVAGARPDPDGPPVDALARRFARSAPGRDPFEGAEGAEGAPAPGEHTTLAVVATDVAMDDGSLEQLLAVAATALPRRITPVFTPFDGDVIFGVVPLEPGSAPALPPTETLALGAAAREALERAILRAVQPDPDA
jgi:L-aminopeptidase/D-esterase-like protein